MEYLQSRHANIRSNIESRYSSLGISATIPSFESYAFKLDNTSPTVVSYTPTIIDNTSSISVTFSEPMDVTSLSTNTTSSTCSSSFQFSSDNFSSCLVMSASPSASNSDKTFTVTPSNNLSNVTSYQTRIKSSVKDVAGNSLADDYSVSIGVDSYNLITGSITVKIGGTTQAGATSDYWCSPLNDCSCGIGFSGNTSSAQFIASISGTYPPFSYEWYFDGTKESTSDNLSISYSAGNHKVKLYVTDNQSNRIFAGKTSCSELDEEFIFFN
ncbi:MAG: Ig-like domain-containing protein [SAR324 cluster bacterium]|nr:Ig-like domain-containing protein [SAR324 cluster bacterium]